MTMTEPGTFPIQAIARTVPAGVLRVDDGAPPLLKISLSLVPRAAERGVPFAQWPSRAEAEFQPSNLELLIRPIDTVTCGTEMPRPGTIESERTVPLLDWTDERPAGRLLEQIDSLWSHVMPLHSNTGWEDLYAQLQAYDRLAYETNDAVTAPELVPNVSGQIALACQIERAIVEAYAISCTSGWQEAIAFEAICAADDFMVEHPELQLEVLEAFSRTTSGEPDAQATLVQEDQTEQNVSSNTIARAKRRVARQIVERTGTTQADRMVRALSASLCAKVPLAECYERICAQRPEANETAGMMTCSFRDVLLRLFYLNQINLRASAMGDREADALDAAIACGKNLDAGDAPQPQNGAEDIRLILSRLRELEENTEFARLFGFVRDYRPNPERLGEVLADIAAIPDPTLEDASAKYAFVRIRAESEMILPTECSQWTLAKLCYDADGDIVGFSPAVREEIAIAFGCPPGSDGTECDGILPSVDGIRLMGAKYDGVNAAHQLSSIDPRDAMQDLDNRLSMILSFVYQYRRDAALVDAQDLPPEAPGPGVARFSEPASPKMRREMTQAYLDQRPPEEPWPLASLKSRSLRLLHHHENTRCSREIGATEARQNLGCNEMALDAADLSIGVLYDLALRHSGPGRETDPLVWHPTSAARIHYSDPRRGSEDRIGDLNAVIGRLFRDGERARYQRATAVFGAALKSEDSAPAAEGPEQCPPEVGAPPAAPPNGSSAIAVADELVHEYRGDQMGADADAGAFNGREYEVKIDRNGMIDIKRRFQDLRPLPDHAKPAPLHMGLGYYMGARDVFQGGGSTPDCRADAIFNTHCGAAVPRVNCDGERNPGARMLRTERITQPLVLLNGEASANASGAYVRQYEPSTTRDVILRSQWHEHSDTYRAIDNQGTEELVVVPGKVDLEFAHRHAAFAESASMSHVNGTRRPRDGLRSVRMMREIGGWSTLDHDITPFTVEGERIEVLNARRVDFSRQRRDANFIVNEEGQTVADPRAPGNEAPSNALFIAGGNADRRSEPYYPEPLHKRTAFRLRVAGSTDDWIGEAVIIDQPELPYPNLRPVAVSIRRSPDQRLRMRHLPHQTRYCAGQRCEDLRIDIPAGLSVELVTWALPDRMSFALMAEQVTLQVMLAQCGSSGVSRIDGCSAVGDCRCTLEQELLEACGDWVADGHGDCGIASAAAPSYDQLLAAADVILRHLETQPLDAIGGHESVRLTHAVDRPCLVPEPFVVEGFPLAPAPEAHEAIFARRSLGRTTAADAEASGLVENPEPFEDFFGNGPAGLSAEPGGTDIDLGGFLKIHPGSTDVIEIVLKAKHPFSGEIDRLTRRRSPVSLRDGIYPADPSDPSGERRLQALQLYGFNVFEDDRVTPLETEFVLARFSDFPMVVLSDNAKDSRRAASISDGWEPPHAFVALHSLFELASNAEADESDAAEVTLRSADGIRAQVDAVLAFTQARDVRVKFRAVSRFKPQMALRARRTSGGIQRPMLADIRRHLAESSAPINVPVPASRRPDAPIRSEKIKIVPRPDHREEAGMGMIVLERSFGLRLSFKRPFLSSGPDEKIGIVLSPRPSTFGPDVGYSREFNGLTDDEDARYRLSNRYPGGADMPGEIADSLLQFGDKSDHPPLNPHPQDRELEIQRQNDPWRTRWWQPARDHYGLFPVPLPLFSDVRFDLRGGFLMSTRSDVSYVPNVQMPVHPGASDLEAIDSGLAPIQSFFPVDLLLYEPRFDIAKEHWYCDIGIDPRFTLDPHLVLSAVRYQPLAAPDLRVSRLGVPIRCKVLPRRRSEIACRQESNHWIVDVDIHGPTHNAFGIVDGLESHIAGYDEGPASCFTAYLDGIDTHGSGVRRTALKAELCQVHACRGIDGHWKASFRIDRQAAMVQTFRLCVEEEDIRAAASLPVEPAGGVDTLRAPRRGGPVTVFNTALDFAGD
jgi:hypothetical protein